MSNIRRLLLLAALTGILFGPACKRNHPPEAPSAPSGRASGWVDTTYTFTASATDPDGDSVELRFDWGDGDTSEWRNWVASDETVATPHSWSTSGIYQVKAQAKDMKDALSDWSSSHRIAVDTNSIPLTPAAPTGPDQGVEGETLPFTSVTTDPDGDSVSFRFDWGDGDTSDWSPFVASGDTAALSHTWRDHDTYQLRAQARDKPGATSDWSATHVVTISSRPPGTPSTPSGPSSAPKDSVCWFTATATDPEEDSVSIRFSWGDGDTSAWGPPVPSGATATMSHAWRDYGTYQVRAQASDQYGATSSWSDSLSFNVRPPLKWRYPTGGGVLSSPAIAADGTVYVGSCDNYV